MFLPFLEKSEISVYAVATALSIHSLAVAVFVQNLPVLQAPSIARGLLDHVLTQASRVHTSVTCAIYGTGKGVCKMFEIRIEQAHWTAV